MGGTTTDAAAAPLGIFNLSGRNTVTGIGAPTTWDFLVDGMYELLVDNVPMSDIGAFIAHPAVWKKMRKLKTGLASDNTPLVAPDEVARLPKLWTTAAPLTGGTTAKGVVAKWSDLLYGVRKQITMKLLDQSFMASNLQLAMLVYARVDFAVGINDAGQVVGASDGDFSKSHAFLWTGSDGMQDLNALIDPLDPLRAVTTLSQAFGINNAGQIVGSGFINGKDHAYLLTPVPEPETYSMMVAGLGLLGFMLRRRAARLPRSGP